MTNDVNNRCKYFGDEKGNRRKKTRKVPHRAFDKIWENVKKKLIREVKYLEEQELLEDFFKGKGRMTSHLQRTTKELKKNGWPYWKVEYWNGFAGKRIDLFNIIDLLAINPEVSTIGIQVCGTDFQEHIRKITETHIDNSILWLSVPFNRLELWGWRRLLAKRGGKRKIWKPRIVDFWVEGGKVLWKERK
jgi:hypothetical protein